MKRQMLKWFGHMERMEEGKMTSRVYMSEIEGGNRHRHADKHGRDELFRDGNDGRLSSASVVRQEEEMAIVVLRKMWVRYLQ